MWGNVHLVGPCPCPPLQFAVPVSWCHNSLPLSFSQFIFKKEIRSEVCVCARVRERCGERMGVHALNMRQLQKLFLLHEERASDPHHSLSGVAVSQVASQPRASRVPLSGRRYFLSFAMGGGHKNSKLLLAGIRMRKGLWVSTILSSIRIVIQGGLLY